MINSRRHRVGQQGFARGFRSANRVEEGVGLMVKDGFFGGENTRVFVKEMLSTEFGSFADSFARLSDFLRELTGVYIAKHFFSKHNPSNGFHIGRDGGI